MTDDPVRDRSLAATDLLRVAAREDYEIIRVHIGTLPAHFTSVNAFLHFRQRRPRLCKLYESVHISTMDAGDLLDIIEARRRELGLTQADVARRAGRKSSTGTALIQNVKRGKSPTLQNISAICDALDLELYIGPRRGPALSPEQQVDKLAMDELRAAMASAMVPRLEVTGVGIEDQGYAAIPVYDVDAAAGNGFVPLSEAAPGSIAFTRAWLMRHGLAADLAGIVRVRGDSMAPTIPDGAHVLVDFRARAEARASGVCILRHDGAILVKRLVWPQRDGERWVALVSDNPAHLPVFIRAPERPAFEPLARVRAVLSLV